MYYTSFLTPKLLGRSLFVWILGLGASVSPAAGSYVLRVLPHPAESSWRDINDAGHVVGYSFHGLVWPTNGEAVVHDIADVDTNFTRLGMLPAGSYTCYSDAYAISPGGRIVGTSKASNNRYQPVAFNVPGVGLQRMVTATLNLYCTGVSEDESRYLVAGPYVYLYDAAYTPRMITDFPANSFDDSCAMNPSGEVAVVCQEGTTKQVYIARLSGSSVQTQLVAGLSSAVNPYGITIRAFNDHHAIGGERTAPGGGLFYGYVYFAQSGQLCTAPTAGGEVHDLSADNTVVGFLSDAVLGYRAFVGRPEADGTLGRTDLNTCLAAGTPAGWRLTDAVAINNHGVIVASGDNTQLGYGSGTHVVLVPETYIGSIGAQTVSNNWGTAGGFAVAFTNVTGIGTVTGEYDATLDANGWDARLDGLLERLDASVPPDTVLQSWALGFSGQFEGTATLTLVYDAAALPGPEANLQVLHYDSGLGAWVLISDVVVDSARNTISFPTDSFSPFLLTAGPAAPLSIQATAGSNGTIAPTGSVSVAAGTNVDFLVTAAGLYRIASLATNGHPAGPVFGNDDTAYTFSWTNVQASGSIHAEFTPRLTSAGVPWTWLEAYYPGTLDYEAAAAADTDGDGCPAGDEYFADTSPTNGTSALKFLSMEPAPAGLRVEWEGGRNAWQILEECDALPDGEPAWRAIWTNPPVTSVRTNWIVPGAPATQRFYRVRVER